MRQKFVTTVLICMNTMEPLPRICSFFTEFKWVWFAVESWTSTDHWNQHKEKIIRNFVQFSAFSSRENSESEKHKDKSRKNRNWNWRKNWYWEKKIEIAKSIGRMRLTKCSLRVSQFGLRLIIPWLRLHFFFQCAMMMLEFVLYDVSYMNIWTCR